MNLWTNITIYNKSNFVFSLFIFPRQKSGVWIKRKKNNTMIVATTISFGNRNSLLISLLLISSSLHFFCISPLLAKSSPHPISVCIITISFFDFTFLNPFRFSFLGSSILCRMFKLGATSFNAMLILTGFHRSPLCI